MSRHDLRLQAQPRHLAPEHWSRLQGLAYETLNHNVTGGSAQCWCVADNQKPGIGNLVASGPLDAPTT